MKTYPNKTDYRLIKKVQRKILGDILNSSYSILRLNDKDFSYFNDIEKGFKEREDYLISVNSNLEEDYGKVTLFERIVLDVDNNKYEINEFLGIPNYLVIEIIFDILKIGNFVIRETSATGRMKFYIDVIHIGKISKVKEDYKDFYTKLIDIFEIFGLKLDPSFKFFNHLVYIPYFSVNKKKEKDKKIKIPIISNFHKAGSRRVNFYDLYNNVITLHKILIGEKFNLKVKNMENKNNKEYDLSDLELSSPVIENLFNFIFNICTSRDKDFEEYRVQRYIIPFILGVFEIERRFNIKIDFEDVLNYLLRYFPDKKEDIIKVYNHYLKQIEEGKEISYPNIMDNYEKFDSIILKILDGKRIIQSSEEYIEKSEWIKKQIKMKYIKRKIQYNNFIKNKFSEYNENKDLYLKGFNFGIIILDCIYNFVENRNKIKIGKKLFDEIIKYIFPGEEIIIPKSNIKKIIKLFKEIGFIDENNYFNYSKFPNFNRSLRIYLNYIYSNFKKSTGYINNVILGYTEYLKRTDKYLTFMEYLNSFVIHRNDILNLKFLKNLIGNNHIFKDKLKSPKYNIVSKERRYKNQNNKYSFWGIIKYFRNNRILENLTLEVLDVRKEVFYLKKFKNKIKIFDNIYKRILKNAIFVTEEFKFIYLKSKKNKFYWKKFRKKYFEKDLEIAIKFSKWLLTLNEIKEIFEYFKLDLEKIKNYFFEYYQIEKEKYLNLIEEVRNKTPLAWNKF